MQVVRPALLAFITLSASVSAQPAKFGGKYEQLLPVQKNLVLRRAVESEKIFHRPVDPAELYDRLPLSARTTFEAVTHALSRSQLTSGSGKPLGTALELVDLVERVAGSVPGARGDSQFRIYAYLKHGAVDKLYNSREFKREHDNTVYHIGYPISFRQQGGVPSIQFSVASTGRRADIDVDYRPSGGVMALTSGHLTAANSDVRAGDNHARHIGRWQGFAEWWRELMAGILNPQSADAADFTPEENPDIEKKSHGPLPEMIQAYLSEWLIKQQPLGLLSTVSIKAYPCVAELRDGSRPDSKLALPRILNQLQLANERLGKVSRLEDVVTPVEYALPGSETVSHPYTNLFTVQRVHDDIAWAIDCRVRYHLHLVQAIPRPEHKLDESFVVAFRVKDPKAHESFQVQTWQKESGSWKLTAFDIKHKAGPAPADLLARAMAPPPNAKPVDPKLESTVDGLLTAWLIDRNFGAASAFFLPESYACDVMAESGSASSPSKTDVNVRKFLEEIASQTAKVKDLDRALSAAQAAHPELKPLSHQHQGKFLMAEASTALMQMYACGAPAPSGPPAKAGAAQAGGVLTAFHLSRSKQESAGVVSLYWKKIKGEWRVASYAVSSD